MRRHDRLRTFLIAALVPLGAIPAAPPAPAAELVALRSFAMPGPAGLAFDSALCALWVVNETPEVALVDPWGNEIRRVTSELRRIDAIAVAGDHLLLAEGNGTYQRVERDGTPLAPPWRLSSLLPDPDGLFFDVETQDYWVTDDTIAQLLRIDTDGVVAERLMGLHQTPRLAEPQGITRDPVTGNLLVVDDAEGTDSLFEFSAEGRLTAVIGLAAFGPDAEGVTLDPASRTLYVAFDDGDRIGVFHYVATGAEGVPETATSGGCAISGLQRRRSAL